MARYATGQGMTPSLYQHAELKLTGIDLFTLMGCRSFGARGYDNCGAIAKNFYRTATRFHG